jgi:hypothetical protein
MRRALLASLRALPHNAPLSPHRLCGGASHTAAAAAGLHPLQGALLERVCVARAHAAARQLTSKHMHAAAAIVGWRSASSQAPWRACAPLLPPLAQPDAAGARAGAGSGWAAVGADRRAPYAKAAKDAPPRSGQTPPASVAGMQRGGMRIVMFSPNVRCC